MKCTTPISAILAEASSLVQAVKEETLASDITRVEKRISENTFKLAIVALIKCGKSTVNNAFIGAQLLPSNGGVPETSALTSILHNPSLKEPLLKAYNDREKVIESSPERVLQKITEINEKIRDGVLENTDLKKLLLETKISALDGAPLANEMRFEIVDSPGINEVKIGEEVREHVQNLLGEADVVLYLFDFTKLGTQEDHDFINKIVTQRPDILKNMNERAFFVINKVDVAKRGDKFKPANAPDYLIDFLSGVPALQGVSIKRERIFCISAQKALWARMLLNKNWSPEIMEDIKEKLFGEEAEDKSDEDACEGAAKLLSASNFTALEDSALTQMASKSFKLFIEGVRQETKDILSKLASSTIAKLHILKSGQANAQNMVQDINACKQNLGSVTKTIKGLLPDAYQDAEKHINQFGAEVNQAVTLLSNRHFAGNKFESESQAKSAVSSISSEIFSSFSITLMGAKPKLELHLLEATESLAKKAQLSVDTGVASIAQKLNERLFSGLTFPSVSTKVNFSLQPVFFNPPGNNHSGVSSKTEEYTTQRTEIESYTDTETYYVDEWVTKTRSTGSRIFTGIFSLGLSEIDPTYREKETVQKTRSVVRYRPKVVDVKQHKNVWEVDGDAVRNDVISELRKSLDGLKNWYTREIRKSLENLLETAVKALENQVQETTHRFEEEIKQLNKSVQEQQQRIASLEEIHKQAIALQEREKALIISVPAAM